MITPNFICISALRAGQIGVILDQIQDQLRKSCILLVAFIATKVVFITRQATKDIS